MMMRRLPWVLLGLSIAFNFFFAGGFMHARNSLEQVQEQPEARRDLLAERLDLTPQQQAEFDRIRREASDKVGQVRQAMVEARQELWDRVASSPGEPQTVREVAEFEAEQARQLRLVGAESIRQFMKVLTPEQRNKLTEMGRHYGPPPSWPRPPSAPPYGRSGESWRGSGGFQKRMSEFHRRRMLDRFDADGDGKLSDQERAAWRKMLENWRPGQPPPGGEAHPAPGPHTRPKGPPGPHVGPKGVPAPWPGRTRPPAPTSRPARTN
ncbi:MAG: LTXXQ motif protein [Planctomycetes bacterium ADurb.Bin126]|nr:MAG: LTXXQ motif protein [Planctomycetes bacterium ADurb.Bin126]HOD81489.1 Spy/CpxP family protein refolding chaperone [Phycisphaerae bacterium]HQL75475.1 Spy/CpxP family protein refolding chaperone [Phycisphaerae bacterium]